MSKINNLSNKNNGWILCPSKTFPGKFYYFNVVNGEAAWSMNEAEKMNSKKSNDIHKITDKSHCYPEPDTPPIESPETTATNIFQHFKPPDSSNDAKNTYIQPLPIFGQAAFPKYIPNIETCLPSIIWMPIQYPTPVCVPETKRSVMDQITQTSDLSILVQTCGPCCQRFINFEKPMINFDKENRVLNKDAYSGIATSKLFKNNKPVIPNSKIGKPEFRSSTPIKKEIQIQTDVPYPKIRKAVFNLESDSNISHVDNGSSTLEACNKVDNCSSHNVKVLGQNDLRHRLLSKRRNMTVDPVDGCLDLNKNSIAIKDETQKKRVSFDLSNLLDEETSSITNNNVEDMPCTSTANQLDTEVSETLPSTGRTVWYIVVDTDVWLEAYEFIETIVLSDKNCKLLIPHAVRSDIEALSQGECRGRQRVFVARQLARRCATPPQHYVVEPAYYTPVGNLFTIDNILECCIDAINDNYQVIIISNDPQLHIKAKSNNIKCFKLQDVKNTDIQTQAQVDLKKIRITVTHDCDNICSGETANASGAETLEVAVDSYRTRLVRENYAQTTENYFQSDQNSILNYESDSTTNEIKDLKNLNLKDKNREIMNMKRTVPNSNYVPKLNEAKEFVTKTIPNSNIGDGFDFLKPVPKTNCDNTLFHFKNTVPNSNHTDSFLFQNAAKKYTGMQSFGFQKPSTSTETGNTKNLIQTNPKESRKITETPKITETKVPQNNEPTISFPLKNNLNSKFKFNQSHVTIPPSFHFQNQNEAKNSSQKKLLLNEQIKNIELDLKRYCVKNKIIDDKIRRRIEEWTCSYIQIMENTLSDVLQKSDHLSTKDLTPPWTLQEAVSNIQIIYKDNAIMKFLAQKYSDLLVISTCKKGKFNTNMKSNDFMNILGCGILLIQQLKNLHPDNEQLVEADKDLFHLLETIECPIEVNTVEFDSLKTPVVCRSEIEEAEVSRCNFIKEPSYVIDYLKKHYKVWESYVLKDKKCNPTKPAEVKIVRTFGKNLNMLKIDHNKSISLLKSTKENVDAEKDGPKTIRSLNNNQRVERSVAKSMVLMKSANIGVEIHKDELQVNKLPVNKHITRSVTKSMALMKTKDIETDFNRDGQQMIELTQNNQPGTKSVKNSLSVVGIENIGTANDKVGPKLVKLLQNSQPTERSNIIDTIKHMGKCSDVENAGSKLTGTLQSDHLINEKLQIDDSNEICPDSPTHGNTFLLHTDKNAGPKVIRNIKLLDKYEKKLKEPLDLDLLDYSEINESLNNDDVISISCCSFNATDHFNTNQNNDNYPKNDYSNNENEIYFNKTCLTKNDESTNRNQDISINDYCESSNDYRANDNSRNDSCTNDSGFENDSTCAHSVVKIFFTELSESFKIIHKFISDCVKEINNKLSQERRKIIHDKAAKSLEHVGVMIQQMNSIISRELNGTSALRTLLLGAGIEAATDKRISRYRQFVTKCAEQARILSSALEIIVSITGDVDCTSISMESASSCIRYFNVFDVAS